MALVRVLSKEETNFLKLANLLIKISPEAVRSLFNREFHPGSLKSVLSKNFSKLDQLKKKRVITQTQWNLLFHHGHPKSEDFDLTLMVCLLRNLTTITIMDQLPQPSDMSEGAAVSRIKYYRNQIAHSDSGTMSDAEFIISFCEVSMAIDIICPALKSNCNALKNTDIDYSFFDIYLEFVKKENQLKELAAQVEVLNVERHNIDSIQSEDISAWKKKLEMFYVTEAAVRLVELLKDHQSIIVTGCPGSGKSSLAYYVAIHMQETEGYTVLPLLLPSELLKMATPNAKQLFIFDDVFGKYSLNEYSLYSWEAESRYIHTLLKQNNTKVIVTCRSSLFETVSISLFSLSLMHFNLHSDEMKLSLVERKEISKLYLTGELLCQLRDDIIMMYDFFPLLCFMAKEKNISNVDFFRNADQFLCYEIENFKFKKDLSLIALALLVLSNNSIEKNELQIGKYKYNVMLQDLFDEIDIRIAPSKTSILSNLQNLKTMCLAETESSFSTKHDKLFDIISHAMGNYIIRCILRHGESSFISKRLQLKLLNEQHDKYTIMIPNDVTTMYFDRILKDIHAGHFWEVFSSIQMKFERYRNLLVQYLENSDINFASSRIDCTTPLHVAAAKGYTDISLYLIEKNKQQIRSLDNDNNSPLHIASMKGHHEIVHLLISQGSRINQNNSLGCTPLLASCSNGHFEVAEGLLQGHASVNECENKGWYPLQIVAADGNNDLIELLVKYKANVNKQMANGMTPLYVACEFGHFNAVELLIKCKADVNITENNGWFPLHVACDRGFKRIAELLMHNGAAVNELNNVRNTPLNFACEPDIAKILLKNGAVVDNCDYKGRTPLHSAAENGNTDLINILIEHDAKVNLHMNNGMTPIYIACEDNHLEAVNMLFLYKANVTICEIHGWSPLHIAVYLNHKAIVACICDHDAAVLQLSSNIGDTPLHMACYKGNEDIVNVLLKSGASINYFNQSGLKPLHIACYTGNMNITDLFIEKGAIVNEVDKIGQTPLHEACDKMHNEIARVLLDQGAIVNCRNENGRAPLHSAAEDGNTHLIHILIENGANVNLPLNNGMTPVYLACQFNRLKAVKILLNYKADINKCEDFGWSPLHVASYYNFKELIAYLCTHSPVAVNLLNMNGKTPLYFACKNGNVEIVETFLEHGASVHLSKLLYLACSKGTKNIAELLMKKGASVNEVDETGQTPLHEACDKNYTDIAELLLDNGASVNKCDEYGRTSLHSAVEGGKTDLIRTLIKRNANVNLCMNGGLTSVYIACQFGHLKAVKLLLSYKTDILRCEDNGWSPLHVASYYNHEKIVEYLSKYNATAVNISNNDGKTPLFFACEKGYENIVKILSKHGASINYCDEMGFTPFHIACSKYNRSIAELLIKQGARVNHPNRINQTPLYIACKNRCPAIVELLLKQGAEVNKAVQVEYEEGWTSLHVSSASGSLFVAELLLRNNAIVNEKDNTGHTPLFYAARNNHYDMTQLLISQGGILSKRDVQISLRKKRCAIL